MYRVIVETENEEYVLHDVFSVEQIYADEWSETMGKTPTFKFSIPATHPNVDKIQPLSSEIKILRDGRTEFYGRVITPKKDIYQTGEMECVGGLSYLADSLQRPFVHTGTMLEFLRYALDVHNGMVEERKRFKLGVVNVAGVSCERSVEGITDTLTLFNAYLVAEYGGYLRAREETDGRYLDYVTDYGGTNSQVIRFGENMLDLSSQINAYDVITCLIPKGATVEKDNGDGTVSEYAVGIESVNDGVDYIMDQEAIARGWGMIWGTVTFEGVTEPEQLMTLAKLYMASKTSLPEQFTVAAFDLSHIDVNVEALKLGYWTKFVSEPHKIGATYLMQSLVRHITAPQNDTVGFGGAYETISGSASDLGHQVTIQMEKIKQSTSREINRKVENATQLITGGLGGYVVIGRADDGHPDEILIMDAPTKEAAKNLIRLNKNGLGFSNTGYNGPYRNAWTIDGNLVADFITTGTMLADRIRGGILEIGGTGLGKDGKIIIYDATGKQVATIDKSGISASAGTFSGTVQGAKIKAGKNYDVSNESSWMLYADSDSLNIGNNHVVEYGGRYIFETDDEFTGFSPRTNSAGQWALWAAYKSDGDCGFFVRQDGSTFMKRAEVGSDIILGDLVDEWGDSWGSVSKNIIELWERIESLEGMME